MTKEKLTINFDSSLYRKFFVDAVPASLVEYSAHIGFTGTQIGLDATQTYYLRELLKLAYSTTQYGFFHHGDCIGSDEQAHSLAKLVGYRIDVHPPIETKKQAFCKGDMIHQAKDYLVRNQDIVDSSDVLLAAPKSLTEEVRSGTWSTIRRARKANKLIFIVAQDTIRVEHGS